MTTLNEMLTGVVGADLNACLAEMQGLQPAEVQSLEAERVWEARKKIFALEEALALCPNAMLGDNPACPLKHSFGGGIYMREIRIPAGVTLTGKIHRHSHPNVLLQGEALIYTEGWGVEHLRAPRAMISLPGTKRAIHAITDLWWITFHNVGEERDLSAIENMVICQSFEEFERERAAQAESEAL